MRLLLCTIVGLSNRAARGINKGPSNIGGDMNLDPKDVPQNNHHLSTTNSLEGMAMNNPFSKLIERDVTFRRVTSRNDIAEDFFIDVYRKAFAGAPYFEQFDAEFVREKVWKPHQDQLIIVAEEKGKTIGLICGHRLSQSTISPSACDFIRDQIGPVIREEGIFYFSELAVAPTHQKLGIASVLVASALTWAAENLIPKFILRTAAEGSNSVGIFKKFGAKELNLIQDVASAEAGGPESASNKRIYLGGNVNWKGDFLVRLGDRVDDTISEARRGFCHG